MNDDPLEKSPEEKTWQVPTPEEMQAEFPAYEIVELIGVGGMGAVYRARQLSLDRMVAIKVLPPDPEGDAEQSREQFTNEARALGRLSHPNIIGVHDFGVSPGGLYFLCMEYFCGSTLFEKITKESRIPGVKALPLIIPVCDALHYVHSHGVIHRDIKPENILINSDGHVRVADFGLARLEDIHGNSRREVMMGTPDYGLLSKICGSAEAPVTRPRHGTRPVPALCSCDARMISPASPELCDSCLPSLHW